MGRAAWTAAVAFAAGLVTGLLIRGGVGPPADGDAPRTDAAVLNPRPGREAPRPARSAGRTPAEEPDDGTASAATSPRPAEDVREIALDEAAPVLRELLVEVVESDGTPAGSAQVYALPVGARGGNGGGDVTANYADADGRCRLLLPSPASFDVTATMRYVHARAEDVRLPGATSVRLQLPPPSVATFVLDPERPPDGDVSFSIGTPPGVVPHQYAARGEARYVDGWGGMVGPLHPRHELPLGPQEFEVKVAQAPDRPLSDVSVVFEPSRFVPPATIRVRRSDAIVRALSVVLTFRESADAMPRDRMFRYRLDFDGDAVDESYWFARDAPQPWTHGTSRLVRSTTGTLRWSGPGLVPGAATWDLGASANLAATVEARPPSPADGVRVLVDLTAADADDDDEGCVFVYCPEPDDAGDAQRYSVPVGREVVLDDVHGWLLVDVDRDEGPSRRLVAGPVRARPGDAVTLKPRPGGFVVFAPASLPPEGAGTLTIARTDGAPFPFSQGGDQGHACRADFTPGTILGPFEPGTIVVDLAFGGVRWGRYEIAVREGGFTTFSPRAFR